MQNDILAQFRRGNAAGPVAEGAADQYCAFQTRDSNNRLRIRGAQGVIQAPLYNMLLNVIYDSKGTNFILIYSIVNVLVQGRNLQKVIFAIENGLADYIQVFDEDRWEVPSDKNLAFIESIEFQMKDENAKGNAPRH